MRCPVCSTDQSAEPAAFLEHVNHCAAAPHPLFTIRLHERAHVTGFGECEALGGWPSPPAALAQLTASTRAIVLLGGPSYSLSDADCHVVHEEGGRALLLGSEAVSRSAPGLSRAGVRCIVNCAGNSVPLEAPVREGLGIALSEHLDFVDKARVEGQDNLALIERGCDAVLQAFALGAPGGGGGNNVLVHCVAGVSRSASVCIAFLVKHRGRTLLEAASQVKAARAVVFPNAGFWRALRELEHRVRGEVTVPEELVERFHPKEAYPVSTHIFGDSHRS